MTHLLFRFRHVSHGRSLRALELLASFPEIIDFGLDRLCPVTARDLPGDAVAIGIGPADDTDV